MLRASFPFHLPPLDDDSGLTELAGWKGINDDDDENHYPFPLVMKPRNRSDSLASAISGTATPSGGRKISEQDLAQADAALCNVEGIHADGVNGHH